MRLCRKNDPNWTWPCSCDACAAAASCYWMDLFRKVEVGEMTLDEANNIFDRWER